MHELSCQDNEVSGKIVAGYKIDRSISIRIMDYASNQDCATNIDQDIDMQLHINASAGSEEDESKVNVCMLYPIYE